jgi:hypothetical protein
LVLHRYDGFLLFLAFSLSRFALDRQVVEQNRRRPYPQMVVPQDSQVEGFAMIGLWQCGQSFMIKQRMPVFSCRGKQYFGEANWPIRIGAVNFYPFSDITGNQYLPISIGEGANGSSIHNSKLVRSAQGSFGTLMRGRPVPAVPCSIRDSGRPVVADRDEKQDESPQVDSQSH